MKRPLYWTAVWIVTDWVGLGLAIAAITIISAPVVAVLLLLIR